MTQPQEMCLGFGEVEERDPAARTGDAGQFDEQDAEVGDVAQSEAAHGAIEGRSAERAEKSIRVDQGAGGAGVGEHPRGQVHPDRAQEAAVELTA